MSTLWCSITELSLCFGLILIILYGLFSLSIVGVLDSSRQQNITGAFSVKMVNLHLKDVYFFAQIWPIMLLMGYIVDFPLVNNQLNNTLIDVSMATLAFQYNGIDVLLIILTVIILKSFKSFESVLLLLLAFIGQLFMLHSCDLVTFYICLEAQNFCFLVLCGLQPRVLKYSTSRGSRPLVGVEASIKYLLLSAFSSGVLLFWFSILYLRTGITTLSWGPFSTMPFESSSIYDIIPQMMILIALMFKLGGAPLHVWMVDIYSGVKRQLLMYLSTAPKLSLFGFWVSTWHSVWTDFTLFLFVALSMIIGSFGAYNQPTLRALFAYSTINEIGLMLMAIETAGFHSMFQHLTIYIVTMLLLWNITDHRFFSILAVSLAGMPPLAGFFGKAWIFNSVAVSSVAGPYLALLMVSLFCTGISLVYYIRIFRLFTMNKQTTRNNIIYPVGVDGNVGSPYNMLVVSRTYNTHIADFNIKITSFCVIFLIFAPLFYIKPFVL